MFLHHKAPPAPDVGAAMVSTTSLLRLSASAAVMNAVIPLAVVVQLALLGRRRTALQASFGLVITATQFGTTVFNFLVDGVTAKVGKSIGARRFRYAAWQARMAFATATVCGLVAAGTLLSLRNPLFQLFQVRISHSPHSASLIAHTRTRRDYSLCPYSYHKALLPLTVYSYQSLIHMAERLTLSFLSYKATPDIEKHARPYFFIRACFAPAQCVANAAGGCLGGYGRIQTATALSVCRAVAEAVSVAAAVGLAKSDTSCFFFVGVAYAACAVAHAAAGVALVAYLPPKGETHRVPVFGAVVLRGARQNGSDHETAGAGNTDTVVVTTRGHGSDSGYLRFITDGLSMFVRSFLLQATFFASMVVVSREIGTTGLGAHNVVCQLWLVSSYIVDGFATAGTVLGSKLVGEAARAEDLARRRRRRRRRRLNSHRQSNDSSGNDETGTIRGALVDHGRKEDALSVLRDMKSLCHRVLLFGLATGFGFAAFAFFGKSFLIKLFTTDEDVIRVLSQNDVWMTLTLAQPLNALVFVYDGLVYAFQDFGYARELMTSGVGFVFLPALFFAATRAAEGKSVHTLAAVWRCKVSLNAWRLLLLGLRTHAWWLSERGFTSVARTSRETSRGNEDSEDSDSDGDGGEFRNGFGNVFSSPSRGNDAEPYAQTVMDPESPTSHWRGLGANNAQVDDQGGNTLESPLLEGGGGSLS